MFYVGHSMGSTTYLVMNSLNQTWADRHRKLSGYLLYIVKRWWRLCLLRGPQNHKSVFHTTRILQRTVVCVPRPKTLKRKKHYIQKYNWLSIIFDLICLKHLIRSRTVTNRIFILWNDLFSIKYHESHYQLVKYSTVLDKIMCAWRISVLCFLFASSIPNLYCRAYTAPNSVIRDQYQ